MISNVEILIAHLLIFICVPIQLFDCGVINFHIINGTKIYHYRHVENFVGGAPDPYQKKKRSVTTMHARAGQLKFGKNDQLLIRHKREATQIIKTTENPKTDKVELSDERKAEVRVITMSLFILFMPLLYYYQMKRTAFCMINTAKDATLRLAHKYVPGVRMNSAGELSFYMPSPEEIDAVQDLAIDLVPGKLGKMLEQVQLGDYIGVQAKPPPRSPSYNDFDDVEDAIRKGDRHMMGNKKEKMRAMKNFMKKRKAKKKSKPKRKMKKRKKGFF